MEIPENYIVLDKYIYESEINNIKKNINTAILKQ